MAAVAEQVIEFFGGLFEKVFGQAFRPAPDLLRPKAVLRQIEEAADASSQSLSRA